MTLQGVDIAWDRPTIDQIKAVGAHFVARYFSTDPSKNLRASEVTAYAAAGLGTVVVWETTAGRATAGRAAGVADAQAVEAQRKAVGLPADMVIHFAVDTDTTWSSVAAYMAGAASVLGQQRVGVYGGFQVIEGAAAAGYRYLWQTVAWSGSRWSAHATIRQTGGTTLSGGADWDTAMTPDFGQYPRPAAPTPEDDMPITDADAAKIAHAVASYSHGDSPDVHQTWQTAAVQATAAASGIKSLAAKPTPAPVALTDTQTAQIADRLAANPAFVQELATALGKDIAARMQN